MHTTRFVSLFLAALSASAVRAPAQVLENAKVKLVFQKTGHRLELASVQDKSSTNAVPLRPGSAGWTVRLRQKGGGGSPLTQTVSMGDPGVLLTLGAATPGALSAQWTASLEWSSPETPFILNVGTSWSLPAGASEGRTTISVSIPTGGTLPFYVSSIEYPSIHVGHLGAQDDQQQLLLPWLSGNLVSNPISTVDGFPGWLAGDPLDPGITTTVALTVPVLAYYAQRARDGVYLADGDTTGWWKTLQLSQTFGEELRLWVRHVPDDIFVKKSFTTPYSIRVGPLRGDWTDAAARYRAFLAAEAPWYKGPVGSPANPIPEPGKDIAMQAVLQGGSGAADAMDSLSRDLQRITRLFGTGVFAMWYGWHYPDAFDDFYVQGYLPGRPSLVAAIREAQDPFAHTAAPYIQGTAASAVGNEETAVIQETLEPMTILFGATLDAFMCNGAQAWNDLFVGEARDAALFTRARGLYLDYFGGLICFADTHQHAPGGGNYMTAGRMQQLRDLKAQVAGAPEPPPYFVLSMESASGRYTEEVHMMNLNPIANFMPAVLQDPPTACTTPPPPVPLPNAVTIPFFRFVHDNVKLAKIGDPGLTLDPGQRAWFAANDALTFGEVPVHTNSLIDLFPSFLRRELTPFWLFQGRLTRLLRDPDFQPFHNGTMRPVPGSFEVTDGEGFLFTPGADTTQTPLYLQELLCPGMWRRYDGTAHAFAVANPWVGSVQQAFSFSARFTPATYGFPIPYQVIRVDDDGTQTALGSFSGAFELTHSVAPGEVVYWKFQ